MAVFLVGAGPGDPMLLTTRATNLIKKAEVIIHDRLIDTRILKLANKDALIIDVGKKPGEAYSQEEINKLLINYGKKHEIVVRLKGGDPFVFGRGGEEIQILDEKGITFRVTPGISSALAAPLVAGIPLTHRNLTRAFTVLTTRSATGDADGSHSATTYVFLMGAETKKEVADYLINAGISESERVAIVYWATAFWQEIITCSIKELSTVDFKSPAAIIYSKNIDLDLKETNGILRGKKIVITRSFDKAEELEEILWQNGANCYCVELVELLPCESNLVRLPEVIKSGHFDGIVFSSENAVELFLKYLSDTKLLSKLSICAFGEKTKAALEKYFIKADHILTGSSSKGVGLKIATLLPNSKILYPRSSDSLGHIESELTNSGCGVTCVDLYKPVFKELSSEEIKAIKHSDLLVIYSPSQARALAKMYDEISNKQVISLGESTFDELLNLGFSKVKKSETPRYKDVYESVIKALVT